MNFLDLAQLILAIVALLGVFIQWRNGRTAHQTGDASAAKDISVAYENLKYTLETRIDDLELKLVAAEERATKADARATIAEARADRVERELTENTAGIRILIAQITSATGEKPLWKPKDYIG